MNFLKCPLSELNNVGLKWPPFTLVHVWPLFFFGVELEHVQQQHLPCTSLSLSLVLGQPRPAPDVSGVLSLADSTAVPLFVKPRITMGHWAWPGTPMPRRSRRPITNWQRNTIQTRIKVGMCGNGSLWVWSWATQTGNGVGYFEHLGRRS